MPLSLDISDDFVDVVDNLAAITVRPAVAEGAEKISSGHFSDSDISEWTAGGGGALTLDDGLLRIENGSVETAIATTNGTSYRLSATVYVPTAGSSVTLAVDGNDDQEFENASSGRFSFDFTAIGSSEDISISVSSLDFHLDDVSVRQIFDVSITNSLRRDISNREIIASGGRYEAGDSAFHIPASEMATRPDMGAIIIDADGQEWIVIDVAEHTFRSRWRCIARRLRITADTGNLIAIERATMAKGDNHADEPTWEAFAEMTGHIQPIAQGIVTENDLRHFPQMVEIICEVPVPLGRPLRVRRLRDGVYESTYYKVTGSRNPEALGEKFVLTAEATPWPLP